MTITDQTPSRPINLHRRVRGKRGPAIYDRLDAIKDEVESIEPRRRRRDASANERFRDCLRAICLDLLVAYIHDEELVVGVVRDKGGLTNNAGYPNFVTARQFLNALDGLIEIGYVEQVSLGTEYSGKSTRIKATAKLKEKMNVGQFKAGELIDCSDPIVLSVGKRGKDKRRVAFTDDDNTTRWRDNVNRINENNERYMVTLDVTEKQRQVIEAKRKEKALIKAKREHRQFQHERINTNKVRLHRVFNKTDWSEGGRFYGPWWQSIPSEYRKHIHINGKLTCEVDYSGTHPKLLYNKVGAALPNSDKPYEQPYGVGAKKVVKRAFNAMLNAGARPHPVQEFDSAKLDMTWDQFVDGLLEHHEPIRGFFFSGIGRLLQRMDADIAEQVMLRFVEMGQPCLPIHDSFITYETLYDELHTIMQASAEQVSNLSLQGVTKYRASYNGPVGPVTDDISDILKEMTEEDSWTIN